MEIDPKILEECAKALGDYNEEEWRQVDLGAATILRREAWKVIEAYERLKPSPWLPIEGAKGLESQTVIVGRFVGDVLMWAYPYDTLHFQKGVGKPEQWSDGVPTHLMLTPKAPEGK